jgi:hypothetical protein
MKTSNIARLSAAAILFGSFSGVALAATDGDPSNFLSNKTENSQNVDRFQTNSVNGHQSTTQHRASEGQSGIRYETNNPFAAYPND